MFLMLKLKLNILALVRTCSARSHWPLPFGKVFVVVCLRRSSIPRSQRPQSPVCYYSGFEFNLYRFWLPAGPIFRKMPRGPSITGGRVGRRRRWTGPRLGLYWRVNKCRGKLERCNQPYSIDPTSDLLVNLKHHIPRPCRLV